MNREEEYKNFLEKLSDTPLKLDYTYERAQLKFNAHKRRIHKRRLLLAPIGFITSLLIVFILLVNLSTTFLEASERIPYICELAKNVSFSSYLPYK